MRLGVFGGTFDPVHYGHLLLAEQCREACGLDEIRFIPAGTPPHKTNQIISTAKQRVEMLELATAGHEKFQIDRRELERPGPSYSFETLEHLRAAEPDAQLFFLIGADSLADLPIWRRPERIVELATLVVVNRSDDPLPDLAPLRDVLGSEVIERMQTVSIPACGISSSDIRARAAAGRSIRFMTPRAVECYIEANALYRNLTD